MQALTIDAAHSMDLDDAIWVERDGIGWNVTVVIAHVVGDVHKGGILDDMASNRVATRYFAEGNAPMLPRKLADDLLSLHPGQLRKGMVIRIKLNGNMVPEGLPTITLEPFTSAARLAYVDIPVILATDGHEFHKVMMNAARLAEGLMDRRRESGALALYDLNKGWFTTEDGSIRQLKDTRETIGQIIVQEMMVLANAELAKFAAHHEIPILFRNHTAKPHAPNRQEVVTALDLALRHPFGGGIDNLRERMGMTMNKADYGATLEGHYGLNLPAYLHATSPIRRYADLVNQRQFLSFIKNAKKLAYDRVEIQAIADHINAKIAADAQDTTDFYKERDTNSARKALSRGHLDSLDTASFERVVKTCVRYGYGTSDDVSVIQNDWRVFEGAVRNRLTDGRISLIDIYFLLMESPMDAPEWTHLRLDVLDHLTNNLSKTASVASVAMNLGGWSEISYDTMRSGTDHVPMFTVCAHVTVKGGIKHKSWLVTATNIKMAKQRAILALMFIITGTSTHPVEADKIVDEPKPSEPEAFVPMLGNDPVASLQEYAQKYKLPLPDYVAVRAGGPDHAPLFKCSCTFKGMTMTSSAMANKKEAKKESARLLVGRICP